MKLDFGFMHVQGMQAEYNGMGQSGHFPRVWEQEWMKAWEALDGQPSSAQASHSLKQKLLLIALQSSPRALYNASCSSRLLLLCFFPLLSWAKVRCIFAAHAISSRETKLLMWIAWAPSVWAVIGSERGDEGGQAKKCSPKKNLNCSLACGCAGEKYVSQKDYKERFPE